VIITRATNFAGIILTALIVLLAQAEFNVTLCLAAEQ
jgi:hypothetical protein